MAATYFDASAIVKLLRSEASGPTARQLWDAASSRFASRITSVEVVAAIAAAHRNHQVDAERLGLILDLAETVRRETSVVEVTAAVEVNARRLAPLHALKGADAIHLASALALGDGELVVATWDRRLHEAAKAEGLAVAPASI